MAAVFGFGWLTAGYAIGIVISMLIDFVPDATQTITPLLLVPLTVMARPLFRFDSPLQQFAAERYQCIWDIMEPSDS